MKLVRSVKQQQILVIKLGANSYVAIKSVGKKMITKITQWFCGLLLVLGPMQVVADNEFLPVANFAKTGLADFKQKKFKGATDYQLVQLDTWVLRAQANNSASALFREMNIDLNKTPYLNWRWRVENVLPIANQQLKLGDDYPARVYVVVKTGVFPWQTKALNYVWGNYLESHQLGTDHRATLAAETANFWPNPFTKNAMMIAVRTGTLGLSQWQQQRVNVVEDFYRVFGERIDHADGVAIMTDTDNSGGSAVAYYGDIYFSN